MNPSHISAGRCFKPYIYLFELFALFAVGVCLLNLLPIVSVMYVQEALV